MTRLLVAVDVLIIPTTSVRMAPDTRSVPPFAANYREQLLFITKTRKNENAKKNRWFTFRVFVISRFRDENGFCFN